MGTNRIIPESEYDDRLREIAADLKQFRLDREYLQAHYDELLAQYPDEWVAILNEQLVGHAPDPGKLCEQLRAAGIRPGAVLREHLRTTPEPHFHFVVR